MRASALRFAVFVAASLAGNWTAAAIAPTYDEPGFQRRRALVLEAARTSLVGTGTWTVVDGAVENRSVNDLGKHWWPRVFVELLADPSGRSLVAQRNAPAVSTAQIITGLCRNAPDFRPPQATNPSIGYLYFSPVGIGWALHAFPSAITPADAAVVFRQSLHFDPTLSALNMFTGQGTENHMLMGRTGGYLICQAIVARGASDPISGPYLAEARERLIELKQYFLAVARTTYDRGFGEWDSSIYYPYVVSCWLGLHDYATDPEIRDAARAVLDWIAATVALRTTAGVFGGPEQRSGVPLKSGESNLDQLGWLWWGGLPGDAAPELRRQDFSQLVYACLSRYRPPAAVVALARREIPMPSGGAQYLETKPSYLAHGSAAVRQQSRVVFFDAADYSLGAAVARPTGGWSAGDNQDMLWKLVVRPAPGAPSAFVVCGPKGREPWRQVTQWRRTVFDVWHVPEDGPALRAEALRVMDEWRQRRGESQRKVFPHDTSRDNTVHARDVALDGVHASLTFTDGRHVQLPPGGAPVVIDLERAYLALHAVGAGLNPLTRGGYGGFVLEVGSKAEFGSAANFAEAVRRRDLAHPPVVHGGHIELESLDREPLVFDFATSGGYVEPEFDWGFGADREGGYVLMEQPPFRFPVWPTGEGCGRVPLLRINGAPLAGKFDGAVYAGPNLSLRDRVLTVAAGESVYRVDFSGAAPLFSDNPRDVQDR